MTSLSELIVQFTYREWIQVLASILFMVPFYHSLKNAQRTGSRDYVIFAGIFLGLSLHWNVYNFLSLTLPNPPPLLAIANMVTLGFWMFLLFLHALRLRWSWDQKPFALWIGGIGIFSLMGFTQIWNLIISPILGSIGLAIELVRLYFSILLIYVYVKMIPPYSDQRIRFVRGFWIFIGFQGVGLGVFQSTINGLMMMNPLQSLQWLGIYTVVVYWVNLFVALLFFIVGVFFPESMLISQALLVRATKLYDLVAQAQAFDPAQSYDTLLRYIQNLPPELLHELESPVST